MTFGKNYTAVIADDHGVIRGALARLLGDADSLEGYNFTIADEVSDGIRAIGAVRKHQPDLLMLDVSMPHAGGTEVLIEARRWAPECKIVIFTGIEASGKIAELVEVGADGVFCKSDDLDELAAAIPRILEGGRVICQRFTRLLEDAADIEPLTGRERQILNLVVSGKTNREIGETLGISIKTVDRHRTSVMSKADARSAAELIAYALREGLVDANAS
ncbi:MAG: response regulator transcription factor [Marinomonas sp.]|uniref:response regulator transcription factor n=1 Tax=Parasphingorhabdus sp. TaxID=2709688 RepID=UPI003268B916